MKVYRGISLNENQKINTENIGCSWSLCEIFAENRGKLIARHNNHSGYIVLYADVHIDAIDFDNSLFAMETRPHEYEIVLNNVEISGYVHISTLEGIEENEEFTGRVGCNIFEDYTHKYDGELKKLALIEL